MEAIPMMGSEDAAKRLTAWERVVLVFSSPSRAFAGPGLAGSWWVPYLVIVAVSLGYAAAIGSRVGWDTVARNNLATAPAQQARLQQLPAQQQEAQLQLIARITRISTFVAVVLAPLLLAAVIAGVLLGTLNFGFGGHASFGALFAVDLLATLPGVGKAILAGGLLLAGVGTDTFLINDPLGSNPAYYLRGGSLPHGLLAVLSWIDVFVIWQIVLLIVGCSIVAKLSRGKAAAAVGVWVAVLVAGTGIFAAFR